MGNLPTARTITINNGDPVPPALLNEIQDSIVTLWSGKRGSGTLQIPGNPSRTGASFNRPWVTSNGFDSTTWYDISGAFPIGTWINAIRVFVTDNATGPTTSTWNLLKAVPQTTGTTVTQIATSPASAGSGAFQSLSIPITPFQISSGTSLWVQAGLVPGLASVTTWFVEVDWDMHA